MSEPRLLHWCPSQDSEPIKSKCPTGPGMHTGAGMPLEAPTDELLFFASDCKAGGGKEIPWDGKLAMKPAKGLPPGTLGPMAAMFKECILEAERKHGFPLAQPPTRVAPVMPSDAPAANRRAPPAAPRKTAQAGAATAAATAGDTARRALVVSSSDDEDDELLTVNLTRRSARVASKVAAAPSTPPRRPLRSAHNLANGGNSPMAVDDEDL